jgi:hypothetical protein
MASANTCGVLRQIMPDTARDGPTSRLIHVNEVDQGGHVAARDPWKIEPLSVSSRRMSITIEAMNTQVQKGRIWP